MVSSSSTAPNTLKSHFAMSVLGTGPKWRRGQRSGAVSVWPGGIRAGSTPSGTRLLLKNEATAGSIGSAGILPFQASKTLWARGAVGSARESHSRGQGFESPRVHQRIQFQASRRWFHVAAFWHVRFAQNTPFEARQRTLMRKRHLIHAPGRIDNLRHENLWQPQEPFSQTGARFSTNAAMPSRPSGATALQEIASAIKRYASLCVSSTCR